jgi:hypothetical protein
MRSAGCSKLRRVPSPNMAYMASGFHATTTCSHRIQCNTMVC